MGVKKPVKRGPVTRTIGRAFKVVRPLLADYEPTDIGLRRVRGCVVGTFIVSDEERWACLPSPSPEITRRVETGDIQYSRDILCGPPLAAFLEYKRKVMAEGTPTDKGLVKSALYRRKQIQGCYVPLWKDDIGCFSESLDIVLACQSAKGDIVGHLNFEVSVEQEADNNQVQFNVSLLTIHVMRHWRHRGHGNDMVIAAAFIAEDCLLAAFRAMPPKKDIQVSFFCESESEAGNQCAKHFNDYLEFQVMQRLVDGDYRDVDIGGRLVYYDEETD